LLLRTFLSLVVADVDGFIVKQLIHKDKAQLMKGVLFWLGIALPSSFVNALIKYLQSRLSLALRQKLMDHVRSLYFADKTYFAVTHLDKAIPNPEAALTETIAQWSDRFAENLSTLGKPLVDIVLFAGVLFRRLGFVNQFVASVFVWESGKLMKRIRPNFADIVQQRSTLEAQMRFQHTRVIQASEEIAFCRGDQRERSILDDMFGNFVAFSKRIYRRQIMYFTLEEFMTKYMWSAVGLVQVAVPLLRHGTTPGDNAKFFITARRVMTRLADATERLLVGIKDAVEFGGYTRELIHILNTFKDIGARQREMLKQSRPMGTPIGETRRISMDNVPIVTPTGDVLARNVSFTIEEGDRVLVLGPNGCGKSSTFRILCGLWPQRGGTIVAPSKDELMFLPQKPYLVEGTLRDQIIYPHSLQDMRDRGRSDADLHAILELVLMTSVVEAHGGLDARKEWSEVLSGGEKQRLGLSRVFYHVPKFAVLDESTSAINVEAEQIIFQHLIARKISLITISHRQTLFKFHTRRLTFDGEGNCQVADMRQADLDELTTKKSAYSIRLQAVLKDLGEDWPRTAVRALADHSTE